MNLQQLQPVQQNNRSYSQRSTWKTSHNQNLITFRRSSKLQWGFRLIFRLAQFIFTVTVQHTINNNDKEINQMHCFKKIPMKLNTLENSHFLCTFLSKHLSLTRIHWDQFKVFFNSFQRFASELRPRFWLGHIGTFMEFSWSHSHVVMVVYFGILRYIPQQPCLLPKNINRKYLDTMILLSPCLSTGVALRR